MTVLALPLGLAGCELFTSRHLERSPAEAQEAAALVATVAHQGSMPAAAVPQVFDARPRPVAAEAASGMDGGASLSVDLAALSAKLVVPVAGILPSQLRDSYDERRGDRLHAAIDIIASTGTPVLSAADGRVLKIHNSKAGGLMVYAADASDRFILLYGHLDAYAEGLRDGMRLVSGQVIGFVGTTGNAAPDTPHLHFEILRGRPSVAWWEGMPVNPYPLLVR
jgi:peptidoglycan LD-endopeptidase LytH